MMKRQLQQEALEEGAGSEAFSPIEDAEYIYAQQLHEFFSNFFSVPQSGQLYTGPGHALSFLTPEHMFRNFGPEGASVFIFHLPSEVDNLTLYLLFRKFGDLLSARVMVNLSTGCSRGYGFVSFSNVRSAKLAVQYMNGFSIGRKRLKVAIKKRRGKYSRGSASYASRQTAAAAAAAAAADLSETPQRASARAPRNVASIADTD